MPIEKIKLSTYVKRYKIVSKTKFAEYIAHYRSIREQDEPALQDWVLDFQATREQLVKIADVFKPREDSALYLEVEEGTD